MSYVSLHCNNVMLKCWLYGVVDVFRPSEMYCATISRAKRSSTVSRYPLPSYCRSQSLVSLDTLCHLLRL